MSEPLPPPPSPPTLPDTMAEKTVQKDAPPPPPDSTTLLDPPKPIGATPEKPLRWFGEYELLHEVARGGMGVVYRARQLNLNRVVALKMILAGRLADANDVTRFRTEAEAAARLQHPNIVAVHEVGEVDHQHFFTMEFIEGSSLAQRLATGPMPGRIAARYVRQIARAMHYAHTQGILHRDLKPSNVLIDAQDEPHITDFGLAKRIDAADHGVTRTGSVLGTPSYMSPEQASGRSRDIGPGSDTYGIGAILYELLTGRPPFRAESPLDTVMQVLHNDPVPPRLLNPNVDHDLETICLKCLEKNVGDRYVSADELASDLRRYLEGESISARSFNILDRITRTLEQSREHVVAFHTWSSMLLIMALVVFAEHLFVFIMLETDQSPWLMRAARLLQFLLLGYLFWYNRGTRLLPTSAPERELWTIWIGYFAAYFCILVVTRTLPIIGLIQAGPLAPNQAQEVLPYPFISIVAGLAFFIMGSNYWGRCYAFGLAFFLASLLMPLKPLWGPLVFGVIWTFALVSLGFHVRRLGAQNEGLADIKKLLPEPPTIAHEPAAPRSPAAPR